MFTQNPTEGNRSHGYLGLPQIHHQMVPLTPCAKDIHCPPSLYSTSSSPRLHPTTAESSENFWRRQVSVHWLNHGYRAHVSNSRPSHFMWPVRASTVHDLMWPHKNCLNPIPLIYTRSVCSALAEPCGNRSVPPHTKCASERSGSGSG